MKWKYWAIKDVHLNKLQYSDTSKKVCVAALLEMNIWLRAKCKIIKIEIKETK